MSVSEILERIRARPILQAEFDELRAALGELRASHKAAAAEWFIRAGLTVGSNLGEMRPEAALDLVEEGLVIARARLARGSEEMRTLLRDSAFAHQHLEQLERSRELLEEAMDGVEGSSRSVRFSIVLMYVLLLQKMCDWPAIVRVASVLRASLGPIGRVEAVAALEVLAIAHWELGAFTEAESVASEVLNACDHEALRRTRKIPGFVDEWRTNLAAIRARQARGGLRAGNVE